MSDYAQERPVPGHGVNMCSFLILLLPWADWPAGCLSLRLEFTVGSMGLTRFRLIERHYFRNMLLKTFDFEIGFCIPHSSNTCEHIYCLPDLDPDTGTVARLHVHPSAQLLFEVHQPSSNNHKTAHITTTKHTSSGIDPNISVVIPLNF